MTPYTTFWMAWGVAGLAVETLALYAEHHGAGKPKSYLGSLSRNLQAALFVNVPRWRRVTLALYVGFCVWFGHHLWG